MVAMSIKIGLIYDNMGSYEAISKALGGKITATKIRRIHLGENAGWDEAINALCPELEEEFVPAVLLNIRSMFSYLMETENGTALRTHAELTKALLRADFKWDNNYDDEIDDRRTKPFTDFLRGYAHFVLNEFEEALSAFHRATTGFRRLAPGKVDISAWEIIHISLSQQMALRSAYEIAEVKNCNQIISKEAERALAEGAALYLDHALKISPIWQLAFNYAEMVCSADVPAKEKINALTRAIFMNPQLANFDARLKGMEESINQCAYLAPVARLLEKEQPRLLQTVRGIVGSFNAISSDEEEISTINNRDLPTVRRQVKQALSLNQMTLEN